MSCCLFWYHYMAMCHQSQLVYFGYYMYRTEDPISIYRYCLSGIAIPIIKVQSFCVVFCSGLSLVYFTNVLIFHIITRISRATFKNMCLLWVRSCSASLSALLYTISYQIGPHYNDTQLHISHCMILCNKVSEMGNQFLFRTMMLPEPMLSYYQLKFKVKTKHLLFKKIHLKMLCLSPKCICIWCIF